MPQRQRQIGKPVALRPISPQPGNDHMIVGGHAAASQPTHSIKTIPEWIGHSCTWPGRKALDYHKGGKLKMAALCWVCQLFIAVFVLAGFAWLVPLPGDISPGLRQFVFVHLGISPLIGTFYPMPSLSPVFEIVDPVKGERRPAIDGMLCYTNERIYVSVKLETRLDLLVFGWDGIQPYRMTDSPLEAVDRVSGTFADKVQLSKNADDKPLPETIYVIGSSLPFKFDEVSAALQAGSSSARGGIPVNSRLPLRKDLEQHSFSCMHRN